MPSTSYGIEGQLAPDFGVDTWFNLHAGKSRVELADYADQCIYLYCFQSWCPGCHSHGFPTMLRMSEPHTAAHLYVVGRSPGRPMFGVACLCIAFSFYPLAGKGAPLLKRATRFRYH